MKTAIILFNLGGPDSLGSVRQFLFNLFYDKAILNVPNPMRFLLAHWISFRRTPFAQAIYRQLGGKSPLFELTQKQAEALQEKLDIKAEKYRVFICMRYFHPFTRQTVREVKQWNPDKILLLPLYPQYSTTTTGSSVQAWQEECKAQSLDIPTRTICCYPTDPKFIESHAALIRPKYEEAQKHGRPKVIFSAHGLPQKIIEKGDPYQWQVEQTAEAVKQALGIADLDSIVAYQSRVGPLEWIKPYTDEVITQAAREGKPIVVVPIAFVSEHSETLVELDIEYRHLAEKNGCTQYFRVPALGTHPFFIESLAQACLTEHSASVCAASGNRLCPVSRKACPA